MNLKGRGWRWRALSRVLGQRIAPGIDVIVPIYEAYDDLSQCLESLIKYRDQYSIILVNDGSKDTRIRQLSSEYVQSYGFVRAINNAQNVGFVSSVNAGMKLSQRDVILLNSDTVVSSGWASKMRRCAYLSDDVATVTPLTNNGTICSVPKFLENNPLPEGFSEDSFSELIEKISLKKYPEIPTAVGFCMYIKRKALDDVGFFDHLAFGRGYGEENDFCMRCRDKGYRHLLCDDTFVFHRGGMSFLDQKEALCEEHLKIVLERHPDYMNLVNCFVESNPLKEIHENISSHLHPKSR